MWESTGHLLWGHEEAPREAPSPRKAAGRAAAARGLVGESRPEPGRAQTPSWLLSAAPGERLHDTGTIFNFLQATLSDDGSDSW